ncbi:hypothetical protein ACFYU9_03150 [Streptomyces sp. NPDC004327]|uniref:hypothetical protein n=1 Tax=Streptomyces sp. NPDC004327 TaxID=3364699 RepID=UPI003673FA76
MAPLDTAAVDEAVGTVLGATAGGTRPRDVLTAAGPTRIRRSAEDSVPVDIILEARP